MHLTSTTSAKENGSFWVVGMEVRSLVIVYSALLPVLWLESHFIFQTIYILSSETELQEFFFFSRNFFYLVLQLERSKLF